MKAVKKNFFISKDIMTLWGDLRMLLLEFIFIAVLHISPFVMFRL